MYIAVGMLDAWHPGIRRVLTAPPGSTPSLLGLGGTGGHDTLLALLAGTEDEVSSFLHSAGTTRVRGSSLPFLVCVERLHLERTT